MVEKRPGKVGNWLVALVIFAVAAWWLFNKGTAINRAADRSETWPTTTAKVVDGEIELNKREGKDSYVVHLEYDYTVDGMEYSGHRIYYNALASFYDREDARDFLDRYPKGKAIQVHYDPLDPSEALMFPGKTAEGYVYVAFAGLAGLLSAIFLLRIVLWSMREETDN